MSSDADAEAGYLSPQSKQRFTIVAGMLGAAFFIAQILLPMAVMFLFMMPALFLRDMKSLDVDSSALIGDNLWAVERTMNFRGRKDGGANSTLALARVHLSDLTEAGPTLPLDGVATETRPDLLASGERLWVLGSSATAYYENGGLNVLPASKPPAHASRPFVYRGRPAVITLGRTPTLAVFQGDPDPKWESRELVLGQPGGVGSLQSVQAVEAGGSLYIVGQLCSDAPEQCSLSYRELEQPEWHPLVEDVCSCGTWTAIAVGQHPAVFLSDQVSGKARSRLSVVTITSAGPRRKVIDSISGASSWGRWKPVSSGTRLVLASEGMPGSLHVAEIEDGRVTHTMKRGGSFPFGPGFMGLMLVPQLLPMVLSLVLAFVLTIQMRRHRVPDYVVGTERRTFASLWQRALAQLVDLVPLVAGFALPMVWMWRMVADPETFMDDGPAAFPVKMFAFMIGAFAWMVFVLAAYSYFEGRSGKTPGKWLMGIRVLGTDLKPCGFGRALLRNLLMLVDGFFSFLVGALLVALTENWQRLGDLAARTVVVVDPTTP